MAETARETGRELVSRWWSEAWTEGLWAASWPKALEGLTPEQALLKITDEVEALTADQQDRWRRLRSALEAEKILP